MDPFRPGLLPGQRSIERVAVVGLGASLALHQPHRLAVGHVDGREQFQSFSHCTTVRERGYSVPTQFRSSA
jgi:hypothetical protein